MWVVLALVSALCLGFYDVAKKQALQHNRVSVVLTLSVCISSVLLAPLPVLSRCGVLEAGSLFFVPQADLHTHLFILIKAALVLSSWVCAYAAMRHLPISLVSPLNATRPMWTLLGAVLLFGEVLNGWQWAGIVVALGSFYAFSVVGKREGVSLKKGESRLWMILLLAAILLGAASGLYDKYLMRQFDHMTVQVYYTFYQTLMMLCFTMIESARNNLHISSFPNFQIFKFPNFQISPSGMSVVLISVFLVLSDFVYFIALSYPDSLISVVSTIRRSGCIVPFLYGILFLKDSHPKLKSVCLAGVILGMIFLLLGTL